MAKLDPIKKTSSSAPQSGFPWTPFAGPHLVSLWQAEETFLRQAERFSRNWFQRRHDAVQCALTTGMRLMSEGMTDPVAGAQVMRDWQAESMRRLSEDAQEWTAVMTSCSGQLLAAEIASGGESLDAAVTLAQGLTATSVSEPV
ncbi:hypothetical protein [Phaeovulum sp. W22_SRMD_FR3]|uniref:hypothetical protein n=1 Tax=Phaeovulum sp. W22_SRMD_FR3 TaxID=3240274 RepID=UPI003F96BF71